MLNILKLESVLLYPPMTLTKAETMRPTKIGTELTGRGTAEDSQVETSAAWLSHRDTAVRVRGISI